MIVIEKLTLAVYVFCRDCGRIRKSLRERVNFILGGNFAILCLTPSFAVFYLLGRGPTPVEKLVTVVSIMIPAGVFWGFVIEPKIDFDRIRERAHAPNRVLLNVVGGFVFFFWVWWLLLLAVLPKPGGP